MSHFLMETQAVTMIRGHDDQGLIEDILLLQQVDNFVSDIVEIPDGRVVGRSVAPSVFRRKFPFSGIDLPFFLCCKKGVVSFSYP